MSDLYKKALFKNKPPIPQKRDEDDEDQQEEKDTVPADLNSYMMNLGSGGPIKATQQFSLPNQEVIHQQQKKIHDYSPLQWSDFYDKMDYFEQTPIYTAGTESPVFFCLHGAGDSAQSFACLAKEVKKFATLVSFDYRGHGNSQASENLEDLSCPTLIQDTEKIFREVVARHPNANFVVVGHSMGGAIAAKFCGKVSKEELKHKLQGLIVIDVVEGTAIDALPFMEQIVNNRPKFFKSLEQAVSWQYFRIYQSKSVKSGTLKNLASARVSAPPKLVQVDSTEGPRFAWKVDLLKTQKHWLGWFKGLTASFLDFPQPKILMLAEKERMDIDLTIAQMQGKFRLLVLQGVGHYMQEDDFVNTAKNLHGFLTMFRIPCSTFDVEAIKTNGIGKFKPNVKHYP